MKKRKQNAAALPFLACVILMLAIPACRAAAQTVSGAAPQVTVGFDTSDFPQWTKDVRRFEIVAFGSFPFAMLTATFAMDTKRWVDANGMDWSDAGRRYAPWPLKSAGAVNMSSRDQETTMIIAASISVAVALADLVIVQIKRHKARQRAEALPVGTAIITRKPWPEEPAAEEGQAESKAETEPLKPAAP
jgi:hypothetical protein